MSDNHKTSDFLMQNILRDHGSKTALEVSKRVIKALNEAESQWSEEYVHWIALHEVLSVAALLDADALKLTDDEKAILERGRKIDAVKGYRARTGSTLKAAVDVADEYLRGKKEQEEVPPSRDVSEF